MTDTEWDAEPLIYTTWLITREKLALGNSPTLLFDLLSNYRNSVDRRPSINYQRNNQIRNLWN
jgi:hypothetical protein